MIYLAPSKLSYCTLIFYPKRWFFSHILSFFSDDTNDTNLCSGRPVGAVTTLRNGTMVVFRGEGLPSEHYIKACNTFTFFDTEKKTKKVQLNMNKECTLCITLTVTTIKIQMTLKINLICYFTFQDTTSGLLTDTWCLVRLRVSHRCGGSLPPSTLRSPAATARAKHTFLRYIFLSWHHWLHFKDFMDEPICTISGF